MNGNMTDPVSLDDFEQLACEKLPHMAKEFLVGGAADEISLRWNRESFGRIRLRPRVLEDVANIDTSVTLFGVTMPHPILLAPVAYQRLFHADGEVETARGAGSAQAIYVVSTATTTAIEEIAKAATSPLWLQLYLQKDRGATRELIARAEAAGVKALAFTVDTPVVGTRNRQQRAQFKLPSGLATPHLDETNRERLTVTSNEREPVTWRDVELVQSIAHVPVLLKGIMTGDDAARAVDRGVAGIIVSNHGARNLDTVPATIDALPEVAARVEGRVPILLDGGIRRGTDIVKAIALGANAVLIGRPYAFGLAVDGANGVSRVVNILRQELETAMALLGRRSLSAIDKNVLW
ncbi:MAG: 4-hydroxymandelate oxidase [Thermoanaerobaculia bacterium]|jgi:4-hydroxymandelate oxidase|nr:4-hydroxymandelate oxidase [Thermoanaerobaculia bacterium]